MVDVVKEESKSLSIEFLKWTSEHFFAIRHVDKSVKYYYHDYNNGLGGFDEYELFNLFLQEKYGNIQNI